MIEISIHYPTMRKIDEAASDRVRFELVFPKRPFLVWCSRGIGYKLDMPRGYGVAWTDYSSDRYLFAPMPLNVLIAVGIWIWLGVRYRVAYRLAKITKER